MTDPKTDRPVDILVQLLEKTHTLKIVWRPDLGISVLPGGLNGVRWLSDARGWTVPVLEAVELMTMLREQYPDLRVSFDSGSAKVLFEALSREAVSTELAIAEDGDVPDVLSLKSRAFQRAALAYALRGLARKIIALDTGLGKTFVACAYARIRKARTLWITKAGLSNNLGREITKLTDQRAYRLRGTTPTAHDIEILLNKDIQHIIMSYESLSMSLKENDNPDDGIVGHGSLWGLALGAAGFDLLICDEAHNIKNMSTKRWKLVNMLRGIPSVMFLTATPVVNNGVDLFSLLNILDNKVYGSEAEFKRAYMSLDGRRVTQYKKLQTDLLPYMFRRKKEDVIKDLPPIIRQHHSMEMNDQYRMAYQDVIDGMFTKWNGNVTDVPPMILAKINRFRQVVSYAKVEATTELAMTLEEAGEKTLVFTAWKDSCVAIAKELSCHYINGDIPQDERTKIQDDFNLNPNTHHLVLTLDVGREGLNLTGASACIFNDYSWSPMIHGQAEGRAWGRLNDLHGLLAYYVEVEDSIDSFMMQKLEEKQRLINAAVDGQRSFAESQSSMIADFLRYIKDNPKS